MTTSNFERALSLVLAHEGGYVDHPADPGGATNMGITIGTLRSWRGHDVTKSDVRNLTRKEAADIYRARYWSVIKGDALPSGVDYCVFDFAVNSGNSRAAMFLQKCAGSDPDGVIGPATITAVAKANPETLINDICDRRLGWLKGLRTWGAFGRGWSSRIAGVRKSALEMAGALIPSPPDIPKPEPLPVPPPSNAPLVAGGIIGAILLALGFLWEKLAAFFHHLF